MATKKKKKNNEKAKWINNIARELETEDPKAEIHINLLKMTLKKYQTGKRQAMMEFTSIHDRLALELNKCLQGTHVPK